MLRHIITRISKDRGRLRYVCLRPRLGGQFRSSLTERKMWIPLKEIFFIGAALMKSRQSFKLWEVVTQHSGIENVDHQLLLKIICQAFYIITVWTWRCNCLLCELIPNLLLLSANLSIYSTGFGSLNLLLRFKIDPVRLNWWQEKPLRKPNESMYHSFYGQHKLDQGLEAIKDSQRFQCDPECLLEPYFTINRNQQNVPINQFLDNLAINYNTEIKHLYRIQNFQGQVHNCRGVKYQRNHVTEPSTSFWNRTRSSNGRSCSGSRTVERYRW